MYSFFIHIGDEQNYPKDIVSKNLLGHANEKWIISDAIQILVDNKYAQHNQVTGIDYFLVGKTEGLKRIAIQNQIDTNLSNLDICIDLLKKQGWQFINELKGCFAFIENNSLGNKLHFTIGNTGLMQSYVYNSDKKIIITSELKAFQHTQFISRKMIPIETYHYEYTNEVQHDFCFLQNFERILPNFIYQFSYENKGKIKKQKIKLNSFSFEEELKDKEAIKETLHHLLLENIKDKLTTTCVGTPISGGVDSGIVASLVNQQVGKIKTYTIGTPFGNEYKNAKELQEFLSTQHTEVDIDVTDFWEGFLASVWHNEICDPLYAEGYVGFYHVCKAARNEVTQLFTGYGADLILGDFLLIEDKRTINSFSSYWCKRAAWTGEMSPYVAQHFSIEMVHPFWENKLLDFGLSIPYSYKYKGDEVKAILREMAEDKKLLPKKIAWRKKNAFTTGASLDQLFSHCLKIPYEKNYRIKSIFLYYLFEAMFVSDIEMEKISIEQMMAKTKLYVG